MKAIALSQGAVAIIDDCDYEYISKHTWHLLRGNGNRYAATNDVRVNGHRSKIRMHRLLMSPPTSIEVDHINGNGLDNRRCNLRLVTPRLNKCNKHRRNPTRRKLPMGVTISKHRYHARIGADGRINLGSYTTPELAHAAYTRARASVLSEAIVLAGGKL
ncbi:MAG: HNH endonuclease [Chloroflexi bacterium]|nr:HNH endonuclease [Chloroflexota bacterium]